ncbi:MAG: ABC transporter substrate-binding protein [Gammaproteobacteria bacterium]|nr:ABC transporter substrate-binding protein [Gammaproteobacteria bacterium]
MFDRAEAGEQLVDDLSDSLEAVDAALAGAGDLPLVLFLLSVGRGAPLAAGADTSAEAVIELAGGRNALTGFDDYKPASTEAIAASGAEFVLITERTAKLLGGVEKLLARPEIAATPAGRDGNVIVMDDLLLLGFGPRLGEAVTRLAAQLHGLDTSAVR